MPENTPAHVARDNTMSDLPSSRNDLNNPADIGISARDVTVTYRSGHTALWDASFDVPRGTVTALVGAEELKTYAKTDNIAVVVKAEHHCMTHRGVREHESDMTTAIMLGAFKEDPATRDEFYKICMSMKGHG